MEWNKQTGNLMDIKVQAKPKPVTDYKVVGKSLARRDVAWKVYGTDDYVTDVRVPGMLHARVIRPPRAACKVRGLDEASVKAIPGVVRERDFVAVLAPREWDAVRADYAGHSGRGRQRGVRCDRGAHPQGAARSGAGEVRLGSLSREAF